MPRFAANLSMLFTEVAFLDRFARAAAAGFEAVEFLFPYDWPPDNVRDAANAAGVEVVLFNLPAGDWAAGDRGLAAQPGRAAEFIAGVDLAMVYARALGCPRLHAMAGIGGDRATYVANLRDAARALARDGIELMIEPISRAAMPGYFLHGFDAARAVLAEVGAPNLRVQADLFHMGVEGLDVAAALRAGIADIGHVQVASVPGRHEPDAAAFALFELLDEIGYAGWVGCEYRPLGPTEAGLEWLRGFPLPQA